MPQADARQQLAEVLAAQCRFDERLRSLDGREPFDEPFGVETNSPVEPWELADVTDEMLEHSSRYSPTPVRTVRKVLEACPAVPQDVYFVDFGCGKGRVLLIAAELAFRAVIGVEISGQLADIAKENIARFRSPAQQCRRLEVHQQDAAAFTVPADAGVCYFYEPFSPAVTGRIVDNIEASVRRHPRPVVLCFVGRGLPARDGGDGGTSRAAGAVRGRPMWRPGPMVESPDDPYYDAWLFVTDPEGKLR